MEVRIPRAGVVAMVVALILFAGVIWDGTVSRREGTVLALTAIGLVGWLYWRSPVFRSADDDESEHELQQPWLKTVGVLVAGIAVMVLGAQLIVYGVRTLLTSVRLSETFLGMVVIGLGESLEETARMVAPARRGHPELAWGNVVGTVVILLALNLGAVAVINPLSVDPLVSQLHAPFLAACILIVSMALLWARRLGRWMGVLLIALYGLYLVLNLSHMRQ